MMLIGIRPGEAKTASAGATRPVVRLSITEDASVATIGDRRIALGPRSLVVWHNGERGTWHGLCDPQRLVTSSAAESVLEIGALRAVEYRSTSRGADVAAVVAHVDRPIAVVTSGYDGRSGWRYVVVAPTILTLDRGIVVVFDGPPAEWRAINTPVETL